MSEMLSDRLRNEIERLTKENEALRLDAERYRWLRISSAFNVNIRRDDGSTLLNVFGIRLDDVIDAALAAREGA